MGCFKKWQVSCSKAWHMSLSANTLTEVRKINIRFMSSHTRPLPLAERTRLLWKNYISHVLCSVWCFHTSAPTDSSSQLIQHGANEETLGSHRAPLTPHHTRSGYAMHYGTHPHVRLWHMATQSGHNYAKFQHVKHLFDTYHKLILCVQLLFYASNCYSTRQITGVSRK